LHADSKAQNSNSKKARGSICTRANAIPRQPDGIKSHGNVGDEHISALNVQQENHKPTLKCSFGTFEGFEYARIVKA
jgi:hypothetical protein